MLQDGAGSTRQLVDEEGSVNLSVSYTPWGDTMEIYGSGMLNLGYLGGVYDAGTGLIYMGNGQYYDPSTGRFLTRGAQQDQSNPYTPWNSDPAGMLIAPLVLLALVFGRKKTRTKFDQFVILFVIVVSVGLSVSAFNTSYVVKASNAEFYNGLVSPAAPLNQNYIFDEQMSPAIYLGSGGVVVDEPSPNCEATPIANIPNSAIYIYGIKIDENFLEHEVKLIIDVITDYADLLGGEEAFMNNVSLVEINIGWTNLSGKYNAKYFSDTQSITLPYGWGSPRIIKLPFGKVTTVGQIGEKAFGFPEGTFASPDDGAKFVLTHEMTHALIFGNPNTFTSFKNSVNLPIFLVGMFDSNPIIKRNAHRGTYPFEVLCDTIASYLYSPGLLNPDMVDWVEDELIDSLN